MTNSQILEVINTVLTNNGRSTIEQVDESTRLREDLGMDSFNLAELAVRIEAVCGVDVFGDQIINKVGEIRELVGVE